MPKSDLNHDKYLAQFQQHLNEIDEPALVVLKGHLILEGVLDNILATIFFNPGYLSDARLSFSQKVRIARAYCLNKDSLPIWNLILAINTLRNEAAHSLGAATRVRKMDALRQAYLADSSPQRRKELKNASDPEIILVACAETIGFLAAFESDLGHLRRMIDAFAALPEPAD
jgi:hypothetical protein